MENEEIPNALNSFGDALDVEIESIRMKLLDNYSGFEVNPLLHASSELETLKMVARYELEGLKSKLQYSNNEIIHRQSLDFNKAIAVIKLQSLVMSIADRLGE